MGYNIEFSNKMTLNFALEGIKALLCLVGRPKSLPQEAFQLFKRQARYCSNFQRFENKGVAHISHGFIFH